MCGMLLLTRVMLLMRGDSTVWPRRLVRTGAALGLAIDGTFAVGVLSLSYVTVIWPSVAGDVSVGFAVGFAACGGSAAPPVLPLVAVPAGGVAAWG